MSSIHPLLACLVLAGCVSNPAPPSPPPLIQPEPQAVDRDLFVPVVRSGRYTLVELTPNAAAQDLLLQIINVRIPDPQTASVGDAMRYALLHSGYALCPDEDVIASFNALPLPAAHYHLGPMLLGDALQMLAGSAWGLEADDIRRQVCFTSKESLS
ncbi:MAG: PilL N-terminal domain-containing protein [Zoogloeaceae bacterium]|nr:PilL N-terminal domain-containing protein [Zoogloeaceae bacterium]